MHAVFNASHNMLKCKIPWQRAVVMEKNKYDSRVKSGKVTKALVRDN